MWRKLCRLYVITSRRDVIEPTDKAYTNRKRGKINCTCVGVGERRRKEGLRDVKYYTCPHVLRWPPGSHSLSAPVFPCYSPDSHPFQVDSPIYFRQLSRTKLEGFLAGLLGTSSSPRTSNPRLKPRGIYGPALRRRPAAHD